MDDMHMFLLLCQCHGCWWLNDGRGQVINSNDISCYFIYSGLSICRVTGEQSMWAMKNYGRSEKYDAVMFRCKTWNPDVKWHNFSWHRSCQIPLVLFMSQTRGMSWKCHGKETTATIYSPHKGPVTSTLMFSFLSAFTSSTTNNRVACDDIHVTSK